MNRKQNVINTYRWKAKTCRLYCWRAFLLKVVVLNNEKSVYIPAWFSSSSAAFCLMLINALKYFPLNDQRGTGIPGMFVKSLFSCVRFEHQTKASKKPAGQWLKYGSRSSNVWRNLKMRQGFRATMWKSEWWKTTDLGIT